jgi:hypothetical protein
MLEPTTSLYPFAYDSDESLFSPLVNTKVFTVKNPVDVDGLSVVVNETLAGIDGPLYLTFEGGEIWFVASSSVGQNGDLDWVLTIENHADQRALHGSPLQLHVPGELVYIGLMAQHINQLRNALLAIQKTRFLIGLEASIPSEPVPGNRYLASDTGKIYYCFASGEWVWVNRARHAWVDGLADDDHPQYVTEAEANTFHSGEDGGHMVGGEDHDHSSTNQGGAVTKIRGGLESAKGSPVGVGDTYFSTNVSGGTLYVSFDGTIWETLGGVPTGAIAPFLAACPAGWVRYTALDGRFPRAAAVHGTTGGVSTHTHSYTSMVQHYHTLVIGSVSLPSAGSHTHTVKVKSGSGSLSALAVFAGNTTVGTYQVGAHTHTLTIPDIFTGTIGVESPATNSASLLPPYKEVVFCRKS